MGGLWPLSQSIDTILPTCGEGTSGQPGLAAATSRHRRLWGLPTCRFPRGCRQPGDCRQPGGCGAGGRPRSGAGPGGQPQPQRRSGDEGAAPARCGGGGALGHRPVAAAVSDHPGGQLGGPGGDPAADGVAAGSAAAEPAGGGAAEHQPGGRRHQLRAAGHADAGLSGGPSGGERRWSQPDPLLPGAAAAHAANRGAQPHRPRPRRPAGLSATPAAAGGGPTGGRHGGGHDAAGQHELRECEWAAGDDDP